MEYRYILSNPLHRGYTISHPPTPPARKKSLFPQRPVNRAAQYLIFCSFTSQESGYLFFFLVLSFVFSHLSQGVATVPHLALGVCVLLIHQSNCEARAPLSSLNPQLWISWPMLITYWAIAQPRPQPLNSPGFSCPSGFTCISVFVLNEAKHFFLKIISNLQFFFCGLFVHISSFFSPL